MRNWLRYVLCRLRHREGAICSVCLLAELNSRNNHPAGRRWPS